MGELRLTIEQTAHEAQDSAQRARSSALLVSAAGESFGRIADSSSQTRDQVAEIARIADKHAASRDGCVQSRRRSKSQGGQASAVSRGQLPPC